MNLQRISFWQITFCDNVSSTSSCKRHKYINWHYFIYSTIIDLPTETIQQIFQSVWDIEGDPSIARLSLVFRRWRQLAQDEGFRKVVQYYVMYEIIRCLGCNRLYKDTAGFSQIGGERGSLRFYSDSDDAGHLGFCTPFCAHVFGIYNDALIGGLGVVRFN